MSIQGNETRFDTGARLALGLSGLILLICLWQIGYRMLLPGDGWIMPVSVNAGEQQYIFTNYFEDQPTPLQVGDQLVAVEGRPIAELVDQALHLQPRRPAHWQAGEVIRYTVRRDGESVDVVVPLQQRRSFKAYLREFLEVTAAYPGSLLQILVALFIFWRRPGSRAAQLFVVWNVATLANLLSQAVSGQNSGVAELFFVGAYWPAYLWSYLIYPFYLVPFLAHFFLVFPTVKSPMRRHPIRTLVIIYSLPIILLVGAFGYTIDQPLTIWRVPFELGLSVIFPLALLTATFSLLHTLFVSTDPIQQAQVRWLLTGWILGWGIGNGFLFFLLELGIIAKSPLLNLITVLLILVFPISLTISILRYRLFDIDVIIRRTLIYGLVTGLLTLIFFGGVLLSQAIFRVVTGQESQLAIVASTLVIVALFNPLRLRVQAAIDRRFYRSKYDAAQALSQFATTVRDEVDLDQLVTELLHVVQETVQPTHSSLWLKPGQNLEDQ